MIKVFQIKNGQNMEFNMIAEEICVGYEIAIDKLAVGESYIIFSYDFVHALIAILRNV